MNIRRQQAAVSHGQPTATTSVLSLIEWLSGNECNDLDDAGLVAGVGQRLRAAGLPLDRFALHLATLHPDLTGRIIAWAPDEPVEVYDQDQATTSAAWPRDAMIADGSAHCVIRADDAQFADWATAPIFDHRSLRQFVCAPLSTTDGAVGIATLATRRPSGFGAADHAVVDRVVPALRNACELRALRRMELPLLDRTIGRRTAGRRLAARLRRHNVESIETALMSVDLLGSAASSSQLTPAILSRVEGLVRKVEVVVAQSGGLVVAAENASMVAMYPQATPAEACGAALRAAQAVLSAIRDQGASMPAGPIIALHYGTIVYGQIASSAGERLLVGGDGCRHLQTLSSANGSGPAIAVSRTFTDGLASAADLVRAVPQDAIGVAG